MSLGTACVTFRHSSKHRRLKIAIILVKQGAVCQPPATGIHLRLARPGRPYLLLALYCEFTWFATPRDIVTLDGLFQARLGGLNAYLLNFILHFSS